MILSRGVLPPRLLFPRLALLATLLLAVSSPAPASAEEACLDDGGTLGENGARKGVQARPFLKRLRVEASIWGGFFAGDLVSTSYSYGGAIGFYPVEDFGFEASLVVTNMTLAVEKPLIQFFSGNVFQQSLAYIVTGNLVWSPVHLKLRVAPRSIISGDVFFVIGAGDTINATSQGATFDVGIGLKIYPNRYVAIRFDLRDYVIQQEAVGVQRVTNNLVGTLGISLFLPGPRPSKAQLAAAEPAKKKERK